MIIDCNYSFAKGLRKQVTLIGIISINGHNLLHTLHIQLTLYISIPHSMFLNVINESMTFTSQTIDYQEPIHIIFYS